MGHVCGARRPLNGFLFVRVKRNDKGERRKVVQCCELCCGNVWRERVMEHLIVINI